MFQPASGIEPGPFESFWVPFNSFLNKKIFCFLFKKLGSFYVFCFKKHDVHSMKSNTRNSIGPLCSILAHHFEYLNRSFRKPSFRKLAALLSQYAVCYRTWTDLGRVEHAPFEPKRFPDGSSSDGDNWAWSRPDLQGVCKSLCTIVPFLSKGRAQPNFFFVYYFCMLFVVCFFTVVCCLFFVVCWYYFHHFLFCVFCVLFVMFFLDVVSVSCRFNPARYIGLWHK